tara:strand:- start:34674 stop:35615 length:942 start_codon:yes stop_codon:yes gene_type:complete
VTSPQETLQGYFDDLLVAEEPQQLLAPDAQEPAPQVKTRRQAETAPSIEHAPEREQVAREKLAKLLTSAPPKVVPTKTETQPLAVEQAVIAEPEVRSEVKLENPVVIPELKVSPVITKPQNAEPDNGEPENAVALEDDVSVEADLDDGLRWLSNGRPQWAQERFEVLLFEVAGLTLAVPLIALGQIQPLTEELTPLFGQAEWFMGLQPTPVGKIRTINTAKFVMPERYQDSFLDAAKYVISINGLPWGLAVDAVNQPISLEPDDVKWRGERAKRPWLAGTVKQHMCALLDIATMGRLLSEADQAGSKQDPLKA